MSAGAVVLTPNRIKMISDGLAVSMPEREVVGTDYNKIVPVSEQAAFIYLGALNSDTIQGLRDTVKGCQTVEGTTNKLSQQLHHTRTPKNRDVHTSVIILVAGFDPDGSAKIWQINTLLFGDLQPRALADPVTNGRVFNVGAGDDRFGVNQLSELAEKYTGHPFDTVPKAFQEMLDIRQAGGVNVGGEIFELNLKPKNRRICNFIMN